MREGHSLLEELRAECRGSRGQGRQREAARGLEAQITLYSKWSGN